MTQSLAGKAPPRALVLCGGLGTRLRAVLSDRPKSMAPVAGVPFLQLLIAYLQSQGLKEVILGTGYMAESIRDHFSDGDRYGMQLTYSREEQPLGTGGAIKNAESLLSDPALILNGDSYASWSLAEMQEAMQAEQADVVMVLQQVSDVSRYGSVEIDERKRVRQFSEKGEKQGAGLINAGVYLLRKPIVSGLPPNTALSLERDVFPQLLETATIVGSIARGDFIDIGVPEDLHRAQTLLAPLARSSSRERNT